MKQIFLAGAFLLSFSLQALGADEEARAYGEYLAGECATCHARDADKARASGIPPLVDISGWEIDFFIEAMKAFTNGDRNNPAMVSVAKALDDEQLKALAIYFGSLKPQSDALTAKLLDPFKWSPQIIATAGSGNAAKGKALADEVGCSGCHGAQGKSEDPMMPNLAGQLASYTLKQLYDFQQGARKSEFMVEPVKDLDLAKMADLAAWFASLKPAAAAKVGSGGAAGVLALKGDKARLLIGCDLCHGADGRGYGLESPAIGGQKRDYLMNTLMAFKAKKRGNDHYARMRLIAAKLTKVELEQLAGYYAQSAAGGAASPAAAPLPAMAKAIASNTGGKKAFGRCKACHSIKKGGRNKSGPNLYGIVGAGAGKVARYRYSASLRKKGKAGLKWTEANLDAWLKNPKNFIGGRTKMSVRTSDAKARAAVIAYMKEFSTAAAAK